MDDDRVAGGKGRGRRRNGDKRKARKGSTEVKFEALEAATASGMNRPVSSARAHSQMTKEDIMCSLCLETLIDPRLLTCLHSFCKDCLGRLVKREEKQIVCPKCRSTQDVPRSGVDGFPSDLVAKNALAFHKDVLGPAKTEGSTPVVCSTCTEGDPAVAHCPTCSHFLCDFCAKAHKRLVDFCTHKIVSMDKVDTTTLKSFEPQRYCSKHKGEALKLYCQTCHELICCECTIMDHRNHCFDFTSNLRPKVEKEIQEMAETLIAKQEEFQAHLKFMKTAEKFHGEHSMQVKKSINATFDSFVQLVEQQRNKYLQQEEGATTANLKNIWAQKEFIEVTLAGIASGLRYVDHLCSCANDQDVLTMSHDVTRQLSTVRDKMWSPDAIVQWANMFTFQQSPLQPNVDQAIGTMQKVENSSFTVNVKAVGDTNLQNVGLRNTIRFEVEIESSTQTKVKATVPPSVHISQQKTSAEVSYMHSLVYDSSNSSWLLTFTPTYPGHFTVSVFVGSRLEVGDVRMPVHSQLYCRPHYEYDDQLGDEYDDQLGDEYDDQLADEYDDQLGDEYDDQLGDGYDDQLADEYDDQLADEYDDSADEYDDQLADEYDEPADEYDDQLADEYDELADEYDGQLADTHDFYKSKVGGVPILVDGQAHRGVRAVIFSVRVTGSLQPGDRVRRGPNWSNDNEDGGVGSEGVVVKVDPQGGAHGFKKLQSYNGLAENVEVQWGNGANGKYTWREGSFPIELVPDYCVSPK